MKRRDVVKGIGVLGAAALLSGGMPTNASAATDDIVENRLKLIDSMMDKQNKVADSADFYIYMHGKLPSLSDLKNSGLLNSVFASDFAADSSLNVGANTITIVTTRPKTKQYEVDYYKNRSGGMYAHRDASLNTSNGQGTFRAQYPLSAQAIKSKNYRDRGYIVSTVQPSASANNGKFWYDPLTGVVAVSNGSAWKNLSSVKTLYTLRSVAELPSTAVNGDVAIVIDLHKPASQQFQKYMFVEGAWKLVPQNIPFSYNGQW